MMNGRLMFGTGQTVVICDALSSALQKRLNPVFLEKRIKWRGAL